MPFEATLAPSDDGLPFVYMGKHQVVPLNVMDVLIHATVKVIPRGAFEGCHRLRQVEFQEGVEVIGDSAFLNCTSLESVRLALTVKTVGTAAFAFCLSLQELRLNPGLTKIGSAAFCGCISLTTVAVPSTVLWLREGAFLHCIRLQEVVLGGSLTTIGNLAFAGCALTSCPTLPESISSIGYQAFASVHIDDEEDAEEKKETMVKDLKQVQPSSFSSDQIKLSARRELEIHTLQDQLEQCKLENSQLLARLDTMTKEEELLQDKLLLETGNDQPHHLAKVQKEEEVSSLSYLDQDLQLIQPVNSMSNTGAIATTESSCKNWKSSIVQMLGAPVRLSMNKFAELDSFMAAHNAKQQAMLERQQPVSDEMQPCERSVPELLEPDADKSITANAVHEQESKEPSSFLEPPMENHHQAASKPSSGKQPFNEGYAKFYEIVVANAANDEDDDKCKDKLVTANVGHEQEGKESSFVEPPIANHHHQVTSKPSTGKEPVKNSAAWLYQLLLEQDEELWPMEPPMENHQQGTSKPSTRKEPVKNKEDKESSFVEPPTENHRHQVTTSKPSSTGKEPVKNSAAWLYQLLLEQDTELWPMEPTMENHQQVATIKPNTGKEPTINEGPAKVHEIAVANAANNDKYEGSSDDDDDDGDYDDDWVADAFDVY